MTAEERRLEFISAAEIAEQKRKVWGAAIVALDIAATEMHEASHLAEAARTLFVSAVLNKAWAEKAGPSESKE